MDLTKLFPDKHWRRNNLPSKEYKKFIQSLPCIICKTEVADAHHVQFRSKTNKREINDFTCIPLCRTHHCQLHHAGVKRWEDSHGIDCKEQVIRALILFAISKLKYGGSVLRNS